MATAINLGEFEQLILLAILRLGDRAYGVTIRTEISQRAGRTVAPGALYTALTGSRTRALSRRVSASPLRNEADGQNDSSPSPHREPGARAGPARVSAAARRS